jgi:hypothetical protein
MDLRQVYVLDIVGRVIVSDLASGPIETFDLDNFIVGDFPIGRYWRVRGVLLE